MLWNWNHKFFGMKLNGVYLAVRILFLSKIVIGRPSSSLASSGKGMLKNILRLLGAWSSPSSELSASSWTAPKWEPPVASLFFSLDPVLLWSLSRMPWRFLLSLRPVTLCVAHRIRLIGVDTLLSSWYGWIAIAKISNSSCCAHWDNAWAMWMFGMA